MQWSVSRQRLQTALLQSGPLGRCFCWALLMVGSYGIARLMPYTALFDDGWAVWWPVNGITLAILLMTQRRAWVWVLTAVAAGTALDELGRDPNRELATVALCNAIEVLIPAIMLPRFRNLTDWLQQPRLVWTFVMSAVLLGPALSSLTSSLYFHAAYHMPYWGIVLRWGISDVVGIIMFTPLVLVLVSPETYALFRWRDLPGTLSNFLLLALSTWYVFERTTYPIAFVLSPILLLIAIRMGFSGSVLAINLLAPVVSAATLHGTGPFAPFIGPGLFSGVIMVQIFLILAMLMAFPISVARVQQQSTTLRLESAYRQMEMLATADGLTGLANRRRFDTALAMEWRRMVRERQPIAMLLLDVDNFKAYNDCYGHPAGDICLQSIASTIGRVAERGGDLAARYGGEEFVVLLPGTDGYGAMTLAEVVRREVQRLALPHRKNGPAVVTISIGCAAVVPEDSVDPAELIEAADRALYAAKQAGRNQVSLAMDRAGLEAEDIQTQLIRAGLG